MLVFYDNSLYSNNECVFTFVLTFLADMDYNNLRYLDFDWDAGNISKAQKHGLTRGAIELLFQYAPSREREI